MTKKMGKVALEQAASMMVAVSYSLSKEILLTFPSVTSSLTVFSLVNAGRYGGGLGSPKLLKTP